MLVKKTSTSFITSIYRKPTFTGLYLSWNSFVPKSRKINLVKTLTNHALVICLKCKFDAELKQITNIFLVNYYHKSVILSSIILKISNFYGIKKFTFPKCPVYFQLAWIGTCSQFFANKILTSIMHCFNSIEVRTIFTTRSVFPFVHKDILPALQQILVIYCYKCQYNADCVGKAIQWLEIRIAQYSALTGT